MTYRIDNNIYQPILIDNMVTMCQFIYTIYKLLSSNLEYGIITRMNRNIRLATNRILLNISKEIYLPKCETYT